jgi:hypothetical protein
VTSTSNAGVGAVKQPHPLIKLAAVVSDVVLVSGFVCYRAGAVNWFVRKSAPLHEPSTSDDLNVLVDNSTGSLMFIARSKSEAGLIRPPALNNQPAATPEQRLPKPPILMSGSKSPLIPAFRVSETDFSISDYSSRSK